MCVGGGFQTHVLYVHLPQLYEKWHDYVKTTRSNRLAKERVCIFNQHPNQCRFMITMS